MFQALVVTQWVAEADDTSENPSNHALIKDEYDLQRCTDFTGQPAVNLVVVPNEYSVRIICEEDVLAAIDADADYEVLWSEEIIEGV